MRLSLRTTALLILTAAISSACGNGKSAATPGNKTPSVTVAMPSVTSVSDIIELDGVVAPSASVNLVARVAGFLQEAPFNEGAPVRRGQLLFVIEPEPYREQVKLNQARLDQARAEAGRQESLLRDNATSQSSVENARSQLEQAEVNLRLAQINLDYSQVRASFDGVVGRRLIDVGNYVGAAPGGTVLGTVQKLRPASIGFTLSERDLLRLRERMPEGGHGARDAVGTLKVSARLQGESAPSEEGVLDFIDNSLNTGTGTMQLRARFDNAQLRLIPGLYARVSLEVGQPRVAMLVPNAALLADQQGSYVFLLDQEDRVMRRDVKPGEQFGAQREVLEGLQTNDRVVVNGISNISEGQQVTFTDVTETAAAATGSATR